MGDMVKELLVLLVMFWNLENFFDPFPGNSGIKNLNADVGVEEPYTPRGEKFWTWKKFERKRDDIARTVALVKEEYNLFPAIIGLAEVENRFVLNQLVQNSILAPLGYNIIHRDSPDRRGIDVALLYRASQFRPVTVEFVPLREPAPASSVLENHKDSTQIGMIVPTREMLYVKGVLKEFDTLHLFVVHWPSKLGGKEAVARREEAARGLVLRCDSITAVNPGANLIVMGDFNDDLADNATLCAGSLTKICSVRTSREDAAGKNAAKRGTMREETAGKEAAKRETMREETAGKEAAKRETAREKTAGEGAVMRKTTKENTAGKCVAMLDNARRNNVGGTYKYKGKWERIDHFLVSRQMLGSEGLKYLYCREDGSDIFAHPFLLEDDKNYLGYKVRRTLVGPRYNGGVSDHLPILLRVYGYAF